MTKWAVLLTRGTLCTIEVLEAMLCFEKRNIVRLEEDIDDMSKILPICNIPNDILVSNPRNYTIKPYTRLIHNLRNKRIKNVRSAINGR